jgi:hypothetical protein
VANEGESLHGPVGGDKVALFYPAYVGVHTDRHLFIHNAENSPIVSVKLDYA